MNTGVSAGNGGYNNWGRVLHNGCESEVQNSQQTTEGLQYATKYLQRTIVIVSLCIWSSAEFGSNEN